MAGSSGRVGNGSPQCFPGWELGDFCVVRNGVLDLCFHSFLLASLEWQPLRARVQVHRWPPAPRRVPGKEQVLSKPVLNEWMKLRQRSVIVFRMGKSGTHELVNTEVGQAPHLVP